jgi:hypothetical protein
MTTPFVKKMKKPVISKSDKEFLETVKAEIQAAKKFFVIGLTSSAMLLILGAIISFWKPAVKFEGWIFLFAGLILVIALFNWYWTLSRHATAANLFPKGK